MTKDIKDEFLLTEESFNKEYNPVFQNKYSIKEAFQFSIILPFQIAFPDHFKVSLEEREHVLSYNFLQIERSKEYSAGGLQGGVELDYFETRVEMTYFTNKIFFLLSEKELSDSFNELLDGLNTIITAVIIKNKDTDIYKISKEMLEPNCLYRHLKLTPFIEIKTGLFLLHFNVDHKKEVFDFPKQQKIINYAVVIRQKQNPFVLSEEFMITAKRNFKWGFYKESILNGQTSVETFLRTLFSECLRIEGFNDVDIQKIQEETNFLSLVKREFSKRIGGSWDITNERHEVGSWFIRCYNLRNRIIHSGYHPSYNEVDEGLAAALQFRIFVFNRINKSTKYKSLAAFL
jgi:HEPN domain-containing protein